MKKSILSVLCVLFFLLVVLAFRPVPITHEENCNTYSGIVKSIESGGENDVFFHLDGSEKVFYVNRGLEKGLDLSALKREVVGKEITIKYPKHWTPLDPLNTRKHISKIEFQGATLFSELIK